jgi:Cu/Ag efflux pump CusA
MVAWILDGALRMRRLVIAAVVAVLALGIVQLHDAKVDVYPEFQPTQVQVQAEALGLSAPEVEQLITVPIEQDLLNGVPWVQSISSRSMPSLSVIDLQFEPGTDLWRARQMVQERMSQAKALPNVGTPPAVIQPKSSTSRIAMVGLRSDSVSLIDMSVLARWQIRQRLMSIPGVAQVSVFGQQDRQLQVRVDPQRLKARHVSLTDLIETTGNALWVSPLSFVEASTPGTGGFVETPSQRLGVQHVSPITSADQLADVAIQGLPGQPVRLGDVTSVVEDHPPLIGDATDDGQQSLMLVVERFPDANAAQVAGDVQDALDAMQPGLKGIVVDSSVYQPVRYLDSALHRVGLAALLGAILFALVIGLLGRSWRIALVTLVVVATSLVAALEVLSLSGQTLTSMTLIGLAAVMALVIDDAVGDTAELRSRLGRRKDEGQPAIPAVLAEAVSTRRGPLTCASLITLVALGPLFLLTGPAGGLVRPAVLAFVLALLASLLVALIVTPVLSLLLLSGTEEPRTRFAAIPAWVDRGLDGLARRSAGRPLAAVAVLVLMALVALPTAALLTNGDALPQAQDRSAIVSLEAAPGTGLAEMNRVTTAAANELRSLRGVRTAGAHVGRAIASDRVSDVNSSEIWVTIADDADYSGTMQAIRSTIRGYPGLRGAVRTYEADRLATAGATTGDELVVRVYGNNLATLRAVAEDVRQEIQTVGGVISPRVEQQVVEPTIEIQVDLTAAQRVGLRPGDVRRDASTLISGLIVGSLYEEQAIFDVVVWSGPQSRDSVNTLQSLLLDTPSGGKVRLGDVAEVRLAPSPAAITRNEVSRSLDVTAQVQGRGVAAVAADVTTHLRRMDLPFEYRAEVVGDAVSRATNRTWIWLSVGAVVALGYLLLQAATGSWRGAAVLMLAVPFAVTGGLLGAQLAGGVLTGGVLAALFCVFALTVRQLIGLVRRAQLLRDDALPGPEAMRRAVRANAPTVIAVALGTAAFFLPAAFLGGAGLELLQPFAITLLLALVSGLAVVLVVVPGLYPRLAGVQPSSVPPDAEDDGRHARPRNAHPAPRFEQLESEKEHER